VFSHQIKHEPLLSNNQGIGRMIRVPGFLVNEQRRRQSTLAHPTAFC
jgi:hypothetical protein